LKPIAKLHDLLERWSGQSTRQTMNDLVGHFLMLAGAVIAICILSFLVEWPPHATPTAESPVVVTVPQSTGEPKHRAPAAQVQDTSVPRDPVSLAREIQRELKRVGCYHGELNGTWNAQSRSAMKKFADQVNAKLPVDRPDLILLRLAQSHQGRACGSAQKKPLPPPSLLYEGRTSPAGPKVN
jgi:hypothetical protein